MKFPPDVHKRALTFYRRNHRSWLAGEFSPLRISLSPPTAAEVSKDDGSQVREWLSTWERHWLEPETTVKRLDVYGTHTVPSAVVLSSPVVAARAAGKLKEWQWINALLDRFETTLGAHVRAPLALRLKSWQEFDDTTATQFIDTVTWINANDTSRFYERELPIRGIDSKWIAQHRSLIESLTGPLEFKRAPAMMDMRSLDSSCKLFGLHRVCCELDEVRRHQLPGSRAIIVENYQTYIALPEMPDTIAIYGQGMNAISLSRDATWLHDREVLYWGDLDSNGFYILDHVRMNLPHTRSVLMDLATARAHAAYGVEETTSKRFKPITLSDEEQATLEFLHTHADNTWLRIEQERIGFDWARRALQRI